MAEAGPRVEEESVEPGHGQPDNPASLNAEDRSESTSDGAPYTVPDGMPGPSHAPNSADSDYQVSSMAGAFEEDDVADMDYDPGRPRRSRRRNWPRTRRRTGQRRAVREETSEEEDEEEVEEEEEQEFVSSSQSDEESASEVSVGKKGGGLGRGGTLCQGAVFDVGVE